MAKIKKAQMEIMGLTIVIVIIIIAVLFVIRFAFNKEPIETKKGYSQTELATNMINAFLETTSNCNELSMKRLLQDCAAGKNIICSNKNSCDYVGEEAKKIFEETIEKWNIDYRFKVFYDEKNVLLRLSGCNQGDKSCPNSCPGNKKSKKFVIPSASRNLFVTLDICD